MSTNGMAEAGWVWEGIGFDPGVEPTVYGVGEGATYFGVPGANFIFHPNNEVNFAKLSHVPKVTGDISKWIWHEATTAETGRFTFAQGRKDDPEFVAAEAEEVGRLSLQFPNIVGAFIDDTHGVAAHEKATPDAPAKIKQALRRHNPDLDLWIVVYTHEFENEYWQDWVEAVDVINLWVWEYQNLVNIDEYVEGCRKVFPDKPIVMGIYIRDYPSRSPVPLDFLEIELNAILKHLDTGIMTGYNILGNCLIDQHPEQAAFIREFIHSH